MNGYGSRQDNQGATAPDIRAMLAASFADEQEPTTAMLARAMIFAQDVDRKLDEAKSMRAEAERYRAEMQKTTVEETEALCREMREEAEQDQASAVEMREETEALWESARAELERATTVRQEAEQFRAAAQTDVEEYRRATVLEAEREAIGIKDAARTEVNLELASRQAEVDDEIRNALAAIEKMQSAAQAELEAQQLYIEALRFRSSSPTREVERVAVPEVKKRRSSTRKPRKA